MRIRELRNLSAALLSQLHKRALLARNLGVSFHNLSLERSQLGQQGAIEVREASALGSVRGLCGGSVAALALCGLGNRVRVLRDMVRRAAL